MFTFDWLAKQAELRPDKTALVDVFSGRRFSYADFHLRASQFAEFLQKEWRIQPGERVALLATNSSDYFEILWGCAKAGVVLVCLNWRLAVPELLHILQDSEPQGLIYEGAFQDSVFAIQQSLPIDQQMRLGEAGAAAGEHTNGTVIAYEDALAGTSGKPVVMPPRRLDELWHILYTAGTTGRPKGVLQTYGMVFYNAVNIGLPINLTSNDVTLNLLPCFHSGGLNMYANPTFHVGGTALIQKVFEPAETLRLLSTEATAFFGVSAVYLFLSQHPDFEKTDFSRMRSWGGRRRADPYQPAAEILRSGHSDPLRFRNDRDRANRFHYGGELPCQQAGLGG
jgi:fatty-acyl-CoA synthase